MRLGIITDTHYGARVDNQVFLDYTKKFLDEVFFPYIDEHRINYVFHLGDLVERRKYVNIHTASRLRTDFLEPLREREIAVAIVAGNHDVYYKDTNRVNALEELVRDYPYIKSFIDPTEVEVDGVPILLVPWMNQENRAKTLKLIKKTKAQICFGHLDLTGFEMRRGIKETDGDDPGLFSQFDVVLTGHFHHKHSHDNIHYLGAPLQFDWSDHADPKGFHIFDTETRELDFIENPYVIFKKLWYNDKDKGVQDIITDFNFDAYAGCFCKLIIEEKTNPYWFDIFVEKLEDVGVSDLQIVEDHHNMDILDDESIVSEAEDTFTIFRKSIEGMNDDIDKEGLILTISELYQEALALEISLIFQQKLALDIPSRFCYNKAILLNISTFRSNDDMPVPLRKIVQDVAPRSIHYEQSETMTTPAILPFKTFIDEGKAPKYTKTPYDTFLSDVINRFGYGTPARPLQNVPTENLHAYKSGNAPEKGKWKSGTYVIWKACNTEYKYRQDVKKAEAKKPPVASFKDFKEKIGETSKLPWHVEKVGDYEIHTQIPLQPIRDTGQMYTYFWTEDDPNKVKFGERWVPAGKEARHEVFKRFMQQLQTVKTKAWSGAWILRDILNVSEATELDKKAEGKLKQGGHLDTYIGNKVAEAWRVPHSEWYNLPWTEMKKRVTKYLSDLGAPIGRATLSQWQNYQAHIAIEEIDKGNKTILADLAPRFGKTLWAATIAKEKNYPLTVVATYMPSALSSFDTGLGYDQFKDFEIIDAKDEDYMNKVYDAVESGKQALVLLSLVKGSGRGRKDKRLERIKNLLGNDYEKLIVVDEADWGAHTENQTKVLQKYRHEDDPVILMTGTNPDRAVGDENTWNVDAELHTHYQQLLYQKYHPQTSYPKYLEHFEVDPKRKWHDLVVPVQFFHMDLINMVRHAKEHPEFFRYVRDDGKDDTFVYGNELPSWQKLANDPVGAAGFFKGMLDSVFNDKGNFPELRMRNQVENNIDPNMVTNKLEGIDKLELDKPRRAILYLPANIKGPQLSKAVELAQEELGKQWEVVEISGSGSDPTTNRKSEARAKMEIEKAGSRNVLFISRGMGARSFSVPPVSEVYLAYDKGDAGATLQKMSRALTFEPRLSKKGEPARPKIARIVSLSFDGNRDDKFDSWIIPAAEELAKTKKTTIKKAARELYNTLDIMQSTPKGAKRLEYDAYLRALTETDRVGRVLGKAIDMTNPIVTSEFMDAVNSYDLKATKLLARIAKAEMGKVSKKQMRPPKAKRGTKIEIERLKKFRESVASMSEKLKYVIPTAKSAINPKIKTFSAAFEAIEKHPEIEKEMSDRFHMPFSIVRTLYDNNVIKQSIAELYNPHE